MFGCHKVLGMVEKLIKRGKRGPAKSILRKHIVYICDEAYEDIESIRDRLVEHYVAFLNGDIEDLNEQHYEKALKKLAIAKAYLEDAEEFTKKLSKIVKD